MAQNSMFSKSYLKEAEKKVRLLKVKDEVENPGYKKINYKETSYDFKITTSQMRKMLSILNDIYSYVVSISSSNTNDDMDDNLIPSDETLKEKMQYFKMRCIYESGRDEYQDNAKTTGVHDFIYRTQLISYLDAFDKITSRKELHTAFIWIFHYMESLVAYHRFLGGKDSERMGK